jgi:DNA-binding NtrC family response regulator
VRFSGDALRELLIHPRPGNVRELENRVSPAVIMARGLLIEPGDLDLQPVELEPASSLRVAGERTEREALVDVLSRHRGNISKAARSLRSMFRDLPPSACRAAACSRPAGSTAR